ncbi:surface-adhesin E family protein [uncultured Chryseobacterium sp.]|uniref:surface-adhesin E family protein n=1 Tax=uncultured Chryseobacterium sp. TaxID=259322 RepID=UPI0025EA3478|nr:surface-adhesin E family protein [uncultured Chryseobacterium sp.]
MKKLLFFFLFFPAIAFAQDEWEYVATTNSEAEYFIRDVVKYDNDERLSVWIKIQKSDKKEYFKNEKYYRPSDRILTKWDMDCQNKTSKTLTMVVYDVKGNIRESTNGPFEETYIIPDSIAEKILYITCSRIAN